MRFMSTVMVLMILAFIILTGTQAVAAQDFSRETIYFILVDRFCDGDPSNNPTGDIFSADRSEWKLYWGGDLEGIIRHLDYIRDMGFTAIWITPVVDNTEKLYLYGKNKEEKITAYHGYWGRDFFRINRFFGTEAKFRQMVEEAHKRDVKIIFDYVLNHSSPEGQGIDGAIYQEGKFITNYTKDNLNKHHWFHHNGSIDFRIKAAREWQDKNLFDLSDFNSENPEVEKYLFDAARKWLATGIDAFRIDTVRHIPVDFATRFADAMKQADPSVFIFGEWSMGGLDRPGAVRFTKKTGIEIIDFSFTYIITDVLCRNKSFKRMAKLIEFDSQVENPHLMVTCIDNHDMPRFISTAIGEGMDEKTARRRTEMATYIMMTSRGIPCIYYGTERFMHVDKKSTWGYGGEPYNRQMMKFDGKRFCGFENNIKILARLRREIPAISRGKQVSLKAANNLWVYERREGRSVVLVAVNKGKSRRVSLDNTTLPDGVYDNREFSMMKVMGPDVTVKQGRTTFDLDENGVGIWCCRF